MAQKISLSDFLFEVKQKENSHERELMQEINDNNMNDKLYEFATKMKSPAIKDRRDQQKAKQQRRDLVDAIRAQIKKEEDGDYLVADNYIDSFSCHGSLYKDTAPRVLNDIDLYVVLNGHTLLWDVWNKRVTKTVVPDVQRQATLGIPRYEFGGPVHRQSAGQMVRGAQFPTRNTQQDYMACVSLTRSLQGRGDSKPLPPFVTRTQKLPGAVSTMSAKRWMKSLVETVLREPDFHNSPCTVVMTGRGVAISGLGNPPRNFDVIPAFLFKKDNVRYHVIPNRDQWEEVATETEKAEITALDEAYPCVPSQNLLGYRQMVKLMKTIKKDPDHKWKEKYGVTSFMVEEAVKKAYYGVWRFSRPGNLEVFFSALNNLKLQVQMTQPARPYWSQSVPVPRDPSNISLTEAELKEYLTRSMKELSSTSPLL